MDLSIKIVHGLYYNVPHNFFTASIGSTSLDSTHGPSIAPVRSDLNIRYCQNLHSRQPTKPEHSGCCYWRGVERTENSWGNFKLYSSTPAIVSSNSSRLVVLTAVVIDNGSKGP